MHAILLDGTRVESDTAGHAITSLGQHLSSRGITLEHLRLRDMDLAPCQGCFGCWMKTPGECVIGDAGREVARQVAGSDLLVFLSPITFGGYSSLLKRAIDRLIPNVSPFFLQLRGETHHKKRYERYPSFLAIGILSSPCRESEAIFRCLAERNALNLHPPAWSALVLIEGQEAEEIHHEMFRQLSTFEFETQHIVRERGGVGS